MAWRTSQAFASLRVWRKGLGAAQAWKWSSLVGSHCRCRGSPVAMMLPPEVAALPQVQHGVELLSDVGLAEGMEEGPGCRTDLEVELTRGAALPLQRKSCGDHGASRDGSSTRSRG